MGYGNGIVHKLGGFATTIDVPMFAHGLIFVVDVPDARHIYIYIDDFLYALSYPPLSVARTN